MRYAAVVYLSALSAQVFAYAFDATSSLTPPPQVSLWRWYLDPLLGPKTLYGVIVLAPLTIGFATAGARIGLPRALDLWTPALLVVLGLVRIGCFLQGCCYGVRSDVLGLAFPPGSPVQRNQFMDGLIGDKYWSLPVVPTQAVESVFLLALASWAMRRENELAPGRLFLHTVAYYSVYRFAAEFVRADTERGIYSGLGTSQWVALAILGAVACFTARATRPSRATTSNGSATLVE